MKLFFPLVYICFSKTGSNTGSTSFSIPSITKVFPSSIQNLRKLSLNLGWFNEQIHLKGSMNSEYLFWIQFYPCPWGSINKGYLDELVTMIPFWIDRSSLGNPWIFHSPTVASSTKKLVNSRVGVTGTPFFFMSPMKYSFCNRVLNSELKGPQ